MATEIVDDGAPVGGDGAPDGGAPPAPQQEADPKAEQDAGKDEQSGDDEAISLKEAKKLRAENKSLRERAKANEAALEQALRGQMSEQEQAIADAKAEVAATYEAKIAGQKLALAAKGRLANPEDAAVFIEASDSDADFDALVTDLLEARPYLAAPSGSGSAAVWQGPQGSPPKPEPKTFADMMSEAKQSGGSVRL